MKFDVAIIGGGLAGVTAATTLQQAGFRCVLIAEGLSLDGTSRREFRLAGGTVLQGDRVTSGIFNNNMLQGVCTEKLGDEVIYADSFVLATGKYFSRGIIADMDKVYEPVFGLDVEYDRDRGTWFNPTFSARQKFLDFGVFTRNGRATINGEPIVNLYPAGEVLAGLSGAQGDASELIRQSALDAAKAIIDGRTE